MKCGRAGGVEESIPSLYYSFIRIFLRNSVRYQEN
jgi:hypothetical protein